MHLPRAACLLAAREAADAAARAVRGREERRVDENIVNACAVVGQPCAGLQRGMLDISRLEKLVRCKTVVGHLAEVSVAAARYSLVQLLLCDILSCRW